MKKQKKGLSNKCWNGLSYRQVTSNYERQEHREGKQYSKHQRWGLKIVYSNVFFSDCPSNSYIFQDLLNPLQSCSAFFYLLFILEFISRVIPVRLTNTSSRLGPRVFTVFSFKLFAKAYSHIADSVLGGLSVLR